MYMSVQYRLSYTVRWKVEGVSTFDMSYQYATASYLIQRRKA